MSHRTGSSIRLFAAVSRCRRLGYDQRHSIHFKEEHGITGLLLFVKRKSQFSDITILEKSIEGLNSPLVKAQTAAGKYLRRQKILITRIVKLF